MHKLGIIGYGGMAGYHFENLKNYDRLSVKGVFDVNPQRQEAAKAQGLVAYASRQALLADPEIDMVLVAATNEVHAEIAIEAMAAGKHVLCEKPATMTSRELEEVIAASKKYGKVFSVDQNRRTNKDFVLMRRMVEKGLLGDVYFIESRVEGSRGMPSGWRTVKALGGGMMLDWGVHLIDQILYMVNKKVTNVYCKMFYVVYHEVEDNFHLSLTFEDGLTAVIEVGTNNFIFHPRWYVRGRQGTLQIDGWDCAGKIVRAVEAENQWQDEIVYTKAGPTKTMAPRSQGSTEEIALSEPMDVTDSLLVVYDGFLNAVEGKAPLAITPEQALRVMLVMEAAQKSAESGEAVKVCI